MIAEPEIKKSQQNWARSKGIPFDFKGYVREVEANLWKPLSARARQGFERGAGSELTGRMKALHSSSALVANFFDYWTDKDKTPLLSALGIDANCAESLEFEAQFPTGLKGTPPHLDVAITLSSGAVVAVESKFTEYLVRSTKVESRFKSSYFPSAGGLWAGAGLPICQVFAEELHGQLHRFEYLDPYQLLKHVLGLAKHDQFSLYYLYYDCPGKRSEAHKKEIWGFANRVGEEIRFKSLTYQKAYGRLCASNQADSEYLDYLEARYFPQTLRC